MIPPSPPWWAALLVPQAVCDPVGWWTWHRTVEAPTPLTRAALSSARADRLVWAFSSGYQAALEHMFGERVLGALAVTEAGGGHPRAIQTTLHDGRLTGTKTFVTCGTSAEVVWVVAQDGAQDGRPVLRVVRLPMGGQGQGWSDGPTPPFVPEVPHGVLHLNDAPGGTLLSGDGYLDVVKPFRTVEDLHVLAACLGFALGEAARNGAPLTWREGAIAALIALEPLAAADPNHPAVHLPLAACFRQALPILDAAPWSAPERWARDRRLLAVAQSARDRRTERAHAGLG